MVQEEKDKRRQLISGSSLVLLGILIGLLVMPVMYVFFPTQEVNVVGQIVFDNPEKGAIGYVDSYDLREGGNGVRIDIGVWQFDQTIQQRVWRTITTVTPDENGVYRFSVPPGDYSLSVCKREHIKSAYAYTEAMPWSFSVQEGSKSITGPIVFIYDQDQNQYGFG